MATYNEKDIYLARRTNHGTFEEAPLVVQPNSMVVTDANSNLIMIESASVNVAHAVLADFAGTASYAYTSSYEMEVEISSSWASASLSASVADSASLAYNAISASVADSASLAYNAISASWAPSVEAPFQVSCSWASSSYTASFSAEFFMSASQTYQMHPYWRFFGSTIWMDGYGGNGTGGPNAGTIVFRTQNSTNPSDLYPVAIIQGSKDPNTPAGGAGGQIAFSVMEGNGGMYDRVIFGKTSTIFTGSVIALGSDPNMTTVGFTGSLTGNVIGNARTATSASYAVSASWAPMPSIPSTVSASWASASLSSSHAESASYIDMPTQILSPTASVALAGYFKMKIGGNDQWVPFYDLTAPQGTITLDAELI